MKYTYLCHVNMHVLESHFCCQWHTLYVRHKPSGYRCSSRTYTLHSMWTTKRPTNTSYSLYYTLVRCAVLPWWVTSPNETAHVFLCRACRRRSPLALKCYVWYRLPLLIISNIIRRNWTISLWRVHQRQPACYKSWCNRRIYCCLNGNFPQ